MYDKELGTHHFESRTWEARLGRWTAPDPAGQFASPYLGMGNMPNGYYDKNGEWVHIAIGAAVGGAINLAINWNNIDNFGEGLAAFGAGALVGGATAACGGCGGAVAIALGGGALTGATNNVIGQTGNGVGLGDVNWGAVGTSAAVGGFAGVAGYGAGTWAANNLGGVALNGLHIQANSALGQGITGAIGGAAGGYAGGFTAGFLTTGDVGAANQAGLSGLYTGAAIGGGIGFANGYASARRNPDVNPLTGNPRRSITIGEGQKTVNGVGRNLGSETISKEWEQTLGKGRVPDNQALDFNRRWITGKIEEGYLIYDAGSKGTNSQFYNLELNTIQNLNYNNVQQIRIIIHYQRLTIYR